MIKRFSPYLALRYLRPKRSFVSIITIISVMGVMLGVAVLIVVMSVMAGFQEQMKNLSIGFDSHIEIQDQWRASLFGEDERPEGAPPVAPWREVRDKVEKIPGVTSVTPVVRGMVLVEAYGATTPMFLAGVDANEHSTMVEKYKDLIHKPGTLELNEDTIVIDESLAGGWGLQIGDKISIWPPSNLRSIIQLRREMEGLPEEERDSVMDQIQELTLPKELTITGVFTPPRLQGSTDLSMGIVPLHIARELYELDGGITNLAIELSDPYQAGQIKSQLVGDSEKGIAPILPAGWEGSTWVEKHRVLFDAVQNEMDMMYVVLYFIVLVAAFCVMNTMITVTVQKRREIGIISSLGARTSQVIRVFLYQGMIVGTLGALTGLAGGLLFLYYRNNIRALIAYWTGREVFDSKVYGLVEIPSRVVPLEVFWICFGAFGLCSVAALIPAFLAARTEPAVALRD